MKLGRIGLEASEEMSFKSVDRQGHMTTYDDHDDYNDLPLPIL